jgi:alpha-tubulin suppressor-like RCC1 family protein
VAAGTSHSLALSWDGRVYSWGRNYYGQLGHGDSRCRPSPALVQGLRGVRGIAAAGGRSLAIMHPGVVFGWGTVFPPPKNTMRVRPTIVEGFGKVRVRRVVAGANLAFAIGGDGELFSWGEGRGLILGHGDEKNRRSPMRVEALRGVRVSSVAFGRSHALALTEDGLVYAWGANENLATLGNPSIERARLPEPLQALVGIRMGSVAAGGNRSYAVADTGEVWAWGVDYDGAPSLGHGEYVSCPVPKPIESLWDVKVDEVAASDRNTLVRSDNGRVYATGGATTGQQQRVRLAWALQ